MGDGGNDDCMADGGCVGEEGCRIDGGWVGGGGWAGDGVWTGGGSCTGWRWVGSFWTGGSTSCLCSLRLQMHSQTSERETTSKIKYQIRPDATKAASPTLLLTWGADHSLLLLPWFPKYLAVYSVWTQNTSACLLIHYSRKRETGKSTVRRDTCKELQPLYMWNSIGAETWGNHTGISESSGYPALSSPGSDL